MAITLESLLTELPGIGKLDPNNYYRAHGSAGLSDLYNTRQIRPKPTGIYDSTYYSQGGPESRYMRKGGGSIIEALPSSKIEAVPDTRRYAITTPENNLSWSDRIKVHKQLTDGTYKTIYDNITPWKFGLRTGAKVLGSTLGPDIALAALDSLSSNFIRKPEDRQIVGDMYDSLFGSRRESLLDTLSYKDLFKEN